MLVLHPFTPACRVFTRKYAFDVHMQCGTAAVLVENSGRQFSLQLGASDICF